MKKIYTLALLATLAIVGCSKVNPENGSNGSADGLGQEISFQVAKYASQTKAEGVSEYNKAAHFGSYALYTGAANFVAADVATYAKWIDDAEIYYHDTTNPYWAASTSSYWPKSGKLTFLSYSPKAAGLTIGSGASNVLKKDGYTVTASYATQTGGEDYTYDLMVADVVADQSSTPDATYGYHNVTKGVPTLFHHTLAKVAFKVKATTLEYGELTYHIVVNSIAVNNILTTGNLAWSSSNAATWSNQNTAGNSGDIYTGKSTAQSVSSTWDGSKAPDELGTASYARRMNDKTVDENIVNRDYFVLPQSLPNEAKIAVNYTIYSCKTEDSVEKIVDVYTTTDEKVINTIMAGSPAVAITEWGVNKSYVYNIAISPLGEEILWDPAVADWSADVEPSYQIND